MQWKSKIRKALPFTSYFYNQWKEFYRIAFSGSLIKNNGIQFPYTEVAEFEEFHIKPITKKQVLVRSLYTIISQGTELAALYGLPNAVVPYPFQPGYTGTGIVVKVGKGVADFKPGDIVAGKLKHSRLSSISQDEIFKVNSKNLIIDSSFIFLGVICMQAIRKARIRPGDYVAVIGQGLLGQLTNILCDAFSPSSLVGIARTNRRKRFSERCSNISNFISINEDSIESYKNKFDIVIDSTGFSSAIHTAEAICRPQGKIVLLGSNRDSLIFDENTVRSSYKTLIGAHVSTIYKGEGSLDNISFKEESKFFLSMLESKQISIRSLITQIANPKNCNQIYSGLKSDNSHIATLLKWK